MGDLMSWREDVIWAAGLFEGEGCISMTRDKHPTMKLSMTDADVVSRFAEIVEVGATHDRLLSRRDPKWKDQLEWSVQTHEGVQAVIAFFWPWLGDRRRARAREVLLTARDRVCATCGGELSRGPRRDRNGRPGTSRWCPACRKRGGLKGGRKGGLKGGRANRGRPRHSTPKLRPGLGQVSLKGA